MKPLRNYYKNTVLFTLLAAFLIYPVGNSFSDEPEELSWPEERRKIVKERTLPKGLYGREDPFAPLPAEIAPDAATGGALKLDGIMWTKEKPMAIINNITVEVGDTVGGKKVIEIKKGEVILEEDGKEYILRISYDMKK